MHFSWNIDNQLITSSIMMISSIFEDKKRTKREEERTRMEKERYDREMARFQ